MSDCIRAAPNPITEDRCQRRRLIEGNGIDFLHGDLLGGY